MAFKASEGGQADGMAIVAGGPVMVDTVIVTTITGGMRQVECGWDPRSSGMALVAGHAREQPSVVGRVGVT